MIKLDCSNFFRFFIYNPKSSYLSPINQKIALIARVILNIVSLTFIPKFCKKKWSNVEVWTPDEKAILCNNIKADIIMKRDQILHVSSNIDMSAEKTMCSAAREISCNQVLHGLFLGNSIAFAEATDLAFPNGDQMIQFSNSHRFNSVVTYCPVGTAMGYCSSHMDGDFENLTEPNIQLSFTRQNIDGRNVNWLNYGRTAFDSAEGWGGIIHDSTYPNTPLGSQTVTNDQADKMLAEKNEIVGRTNIEDWFKETFNEIDKAVFQNRRVLVHCQVGVSRSGSVLAAYLINRFDVTADEALAFLKSKRYCVESKFTDSLRVYQQALQKKRNPVA